MKYLVIELQKNNNDVASLVTKYDTLDQARSSFYTICAAAVLSMVEVHSVILLTEEGDVMYKETFLHLLEE